jgi:peptidoglycan glycosyltransferase
VNAPLRKVAISVLVLFTLLIVNVNIIQVVRAQSLRENPRNTRVLTEEYDRERGAIVVAGNEIASSIPTGQTLNYLRQYPQGPLYAAVTGYYSVLFGRTGLERAENPVLAGTDSRLALRRLGDILTGRDPSGGNVELTLDPATQQAAMDSLKGVTGAVVALDPSTGAILALASTPTYDPAQLSSHDPAAMRAYAESITPPEGSDQPDPRINQAISERYPAGSIFKVVVSAAALASGRYTPETTVPAPDQLTLPGSSRPLINYNGESCNGGADQTLIAALTTSCNTAFGQLGMNLGENAVRDMADAFGINGKGFDIPLTVAPSTIGDVADDAALAQTSIGQKDVAVTPMQAAMIAAAVANDGRLMKPYLVDSIQAPDLTVVDQTDPAEMSRPVSADIAHELTTMMTSVVDHGTGRKARIDGVEVAGKTGTAQNAGPDHNWFIGFAPAADPKIAVAVFIRNGGGTGGDTSAPIAKAVMEAYLNGQGGGG